MPAAQKGFVLRIAGPLTTAAGRQQWATSACFRFSASSPRIAMRQFPLAAATILFFSIRLVAADTPPEGITPVAGDGRKLNFDFETGTLQDWTAEGDAFVGQPIDGDTVTPRRPGMKSQHQGRYWI